jgi:O-antigen/teichoic acid export membrane protein
VQGLLLVPLYLRYLGAGLFGAWLGSGDILGWLAVLDMGVGSYMLQRISQSHGRGDRAAMTAYLTTGLAAQAALVALLALGAVLVAPSLPVWMGIEGDDARTLTGSFIIAALALGTGIISHGFGAFAAGLQRPAVSQFAAVASTTIGIVLTIVLLLLGFGLWALAVSLMVRSAVQLGVNATYAAVLYRRERLPPPFLDRAVAREVAALSGPAFLSSLGSAAAGRSEAVLIAVFIRPEVATVYVLTRRAVEIVSMVLARLGGAVYPGFAHLLNSRERGRAAAIRSEVARLYSAGGALMVALYFALNHTFVALWVGEAQYGGLLLTVLLGASTLAAGYVALQLYLYAATGRIAQSAYLTFGEAMARVGLMAALLWWLGLPGLPLAILITAWPVAALASRLMRRIVEGDQQRTAGVTVRPVAGHMLLLLSGAAAGAVRWGDSWIEFGLFAVAFGTIGIAMLAATDSYVRGQVEVRWGRLREARK